MKIRRYNESNGMEQIDYIEELVQEIKDEGYKVSISGERRGDINTFRIQIKSDIIPIIYSSNDIEKLFRGIDKFNNISILIKSLIKRIVSDFDITGCQMITMNGEILDIRIKSKD
jgi:hypothetical protein